MGGPRVADGALRLEEHRFGSRPMPPPPSLSLGFSVASCEDQRVIDGPIFLAHNFHDNSVFHRPRPEGGTSTSPMPLYIDPSPADSWAISQLALNTAQRGEVALVPRPIPGALEYAIGEGLNSPEQVVPLDIPRGAIAGGRMTDIDILSLARTLPPTELARFHGEAFVSAFSTPEVRDRARELGFDPIQRGDSISTDDKRALHRHAHEFGVATCPFVEVTEELHFSQIPRFFQAYGAWLKLSHAMGGCGVYHLPPGFDEGMLGRALENLRGDVITGLVASGGFSPKSAADVWPPGAPCPRHFGVTLEVDAAMFGEKVLTGSSVVEISRGGRHVTHAYFQQIIGEGGEFLGSGLLDLEGRFGQSVRTTLEAQAKQIGQLVHSRLDFAGVCGIDFILLKTPSGDIDVRIIELNARPPISSAAYILGSLKLGAPAWRAPYLIANEPIVSMHQLEEMLTIGGRALTRADPESGRVTPLHFGTICSKVGDNYLITRPANWCQVVITGASNTAVERLINRIQTAGNVRFGRPDW